MPSAAAASDWPRRRWNEKPPSTSPRHRIIVFFASTRVVSWKRLNYPHRTAHPIDIAVRRPEKRNDFQAVNHWIVGFRSVLYAQHWAGGNAACLRSRQRGDHSAGRILRTGGSGPIGQRTPRCGGAQRRSVYRAAERQG